MRTELAVDCMFRGASAGGLRLLVAQQMKQHLLLCAAHSSFQCERAMPLLEQSEHGAGCGQKDVQGTQQGGMVAGLGHH